MNYDCDDGRDDGERLLLLTIIRTSTAKVNVSTQYLVSEIER